MSSLLEELKYKSVCDQEFFEDYVHAQPASVTALNLKTSELKTRIASLKRANEEASSIYDKKVKSFKEDFDQQLHSISERIGGLNLNQDQPQNVEEVISALGNSPGNFNTAGNPNFTPLGNRQRPATNFVPPQTTAFGNNSSTPNPPFSQPYQSSTSQTSSKSFPKYSKKFPPGGRINIHLFIQGFEMYYNGAPEADLRVSILNCLDNATLATIMSSLGPRGGNYYEI